MSALFSLAGKRALVTGGTRGIGAAAAELLVDCGASVCVGYRSRKTDADAIVARLSPVAARGGAKVIAHAADLGEAAGAESLIAAAVQGLGGLDLVIHSAGVWPPEVGDPARE